MYYNIQPRPFAIKMTTQVVVSFSLLVNQLSRPFKLLLYVRKHAELMKALRPFRKNGLIHARTCFIYLFSYISRALSTKNRLDILTYQYNFLQQAFPSFNLKRLFNDGIECWTETINDEKFSIKLVHSGYLEFEGSLSLLFYVNETCIYASSFTIAPGKYFGVTDEKIIYVSRLQGTVGESNAIAVATKNLNSLIPSTILMSVIEGIGLSVGIKKIIGISSTHQLSSNTKNATIHYNNYDGYWESQGAVTMSNGNYLFSCPLQSKPIETIKAKYRSRTIAKRAKRKDIAAKTCTTLLHFIKKEYTQPVRKQRLIEIAAAGKNVIVYREQLPILEAC